MCGRDGPGGQDLGGLEVRHHVQEVVAEEDPPLDQQHGEADGVPHDARLALRELTVIIGLRWTGGEGGGEGGEGGGCTHQVFGGEAAEGRAAQGGAAALERGAAGALAEGGDAGGEAGGDAGGDTAEGGTGAS